MSIETVTLILDRDVTLAAITKVIRKMIKSKSQRLPKLKALTFKIKPANPKGVHITEVRDISAKLGVDLVAAAYFDPIDEIRHITKLQDTSAKVGVHFNAMVYSRDR